MRIYQIFMYAQYTYAKFHHGDVCDWRRSLDVSIYVADAADGDDDDDTVFIDAQPYSRI